MNMFTYILNNDLRNDIYRLVNNENVQNSRSIFSGRQDISEAMEKLVSAYGYNRVNNLVIELINMERKEAI